jgi:transcriptional regulator with XRE-family HTH domain
MDVGKQLKKMREVKGLSQADVEERSGLLRSYVSRVEGGYTAPSLANLEKLAKALEVEPFELLVERLEPAKKFGPTRITTPFPSSSEVARVFGLSKKRVDRISRLVESVQMGNPKLRQTG